MHIKIPGDGFCGTHALFLRMLMIFYTREKTLSKLQENYNALMALQANHAIEPYNKPDIIAALEPLIAPFPNLKELIQASQRDADTQATDIVARAVQHTDASIVQLTSLQENPDFRNLTRKLHAALGPNSTQRDLYTAIHTIILNFTNPSGAQLPHYLPLLRAFMETVVDSHLFNETIETCQEKIYATLRPQMPKLLSDIKLHQELYNELFTLTHDPNKGDLKISDQCLLEYTQAMISNSFGPQLEPMNLASNQGVFYRKAKTFYEDRCKTFLQNTLNRHTGGGSTQNNEELDLCCREVSQAFIQRRPNHEHPTVDALLRFNIVQPIVARQWRENYHDTPPNIGNLLAIFANTDYIETSCGPSFYTEHTDLILVNDLFPLEDVVNDIHGIQLQHVNGNHWDIQIPDSGFLLDTLRSEPTEATYESPGAEATAASAPPPTQPSHTSPHDGDHSPDPNTVALENRLIQQTIDKTLTTLPPPKFCQSKRQRWYPPDS